MVKNRFLNSVLNRVQTHRGCRPIYCIRVDENGNHYCRFYYPRTIRAKAEVCKDINPKRWQFAAERDQPFCNPYAATLILAWLANLDIQPVTTFRGLVDYILKYCSKPKKASHTYKELKTEVLKYTSARNPTLSFVAKFLNKLIGERDYSAQEVTYSLYPKLP